MEIIEITKQIITHFDAFKGSKPITNSKDVVIVKGMSRNKLKAEEFVPKLNELFKQMNIQKISNASERAKDMTRQVDQKLRYTNEILDDTADITGLEKLKASYELVGLKADYVIGTLDDIGVFVVLSMDKSGVGPMFVEVMAVQLDPTEDDD